MLALDLSGSMQTPDMELNGHYFDRLAVVKIAARKFIQARTGDRLGLILFGTQAYLQTPLTFDQKTVLEMLNDATIGLAGSQTAIGDAVGLALKQLGRAPGHSKVIILLTDGGNNAGTVSPLDAAAMAKKLGIKIYTIGIGAKRLVVQGLFGPQVIHPTNELDEETLKKMAKITGGLFFRADSGEELKQVYAEINKLVPIVSAKNIFRPIKPLYPWSLGLALILSLLMALRKTNLFDKKLLRGND
jgi:Ca-activated chloride channel family protein